MQRKLTKIELLTNDDPKDHSFLQPQRTFKGKLQGKFFDRVEYERKALHWWLMQSVEPKPSDMQWRHASSSLMLGETILADEIVRLLNTEYVFDFDYEPTQNDFLKLHFVYLYKEMKGKPARPYLEYVSFLYSDAKWKVNQGYDHIRLEFELFRKGDANFWLDGQLQ